MSKYILITYDKLSDRNQERGFPKYIFLKKISTVTDVKIAVKIILTGVEVQLPDFTQIHTTSDRCKNDTDRWLRYDKMKMKGVNMQLTGVKMKMTDVNFEMTDVKMTLINDNCRH